MSAATIIAQAFGEGANLYTDVLETSPEATQAQLRKAYYTKALLYHPDKSPGNEAQFQAISVAYEILKDPERRAEYDDTGELYCDDDDDDETTDVSAWKRFFDHQFGTITASDITKFAAKYKCSPEEERDVLKEYTKFKGNLVKMLDCVMLSEPRDTERWVEDYIRPAIRGGQVDDYGATVERTLKQALAKVHDDDDDDDDGKVLEEGEEEVIDEDATESDDSGELKKAAGGKKKASPKRARPTRAKAKKKTKREREAEAAQELMAKIQGKNALARRKEDFNTMFAGIKERYGVTEEDPLAGQDFDKMQAQLLGKTSKTKK